MKKVTWLLIVAGLLSCPLSWAAESKQKVEGRLQKASSVLQEIMNAPDKGIPEEVVKAAKCIAIIPHEINGGLVFGARYGRVWQPAEPQTEDGAFPRSSPSQGVAGARRSALRAWTMS
jgi:lipid-binding SYLF domain-containing protein